MRNIILYFFTMILLLVYSCNKPLPVISKKIANGEEIIIYTDYIADNEYSQPVYWMVKQKDKELIKTSFVNIGISDDPANVGFTFVTFNNDSIVGIIVNDKPKELLALYDTNSQSYWTIYEDNKIGKSILDKIVKTKRKGYILKED